MYDTIVIGGDTREPDTGFRPHTTAAGLREVLSEALRVAPGLANAEIHEVRVGLRPTSPDGLPILGPLSGVQNLSIATGHGPTGLQLGPFSGKCIADTILGHPPEIDLTPFHFSRFPH